MNRQQAELQLQKMFGFKQFHDLQWQVIEMLLAGDRVLFIEKTGFGKSLCYQFPQSPSFTTGVSEVSDCIAR